MTVRPSWDQYFISIAKQAATEAGVELVDLSG
jgi:hypothetical protein